MPCENAPDSYSVYSTKHSSIGGEAIGLTHCYVLPSPWYGTVCKMCSNTMLLAHNNLVDRAHLHNVLELFVHVPQSKLTCMKVNNTAII